MSSDPPLAVVYDLDDTLFPEADYARSGLRTVGLAFADDLGVPDLADRLLRCFEQGHRDRIYNRVLADLGRTDAETLAPRMVDLHRSHRPEIALHPDAAESLRYWRDRAKLGIISDGYLVAQQAKIAALDLQSRVDAIILTDQRGRAYWKPHPWAFEKVSADLGVLHNRCVFVGDNPEKDFIAPRRLGWTTVLVRRQGGIYADRHPPAGGEPHSTVSNLGELPKILQGQRPPA